MRNLPGVPELLTLDLVPQPVTREKTVLNSEGRYESSITTHGARKPLPTDVQVKIVCAACNNGWMSALERAARPIFVRLASGKAHSLSAGDQELLAAWMYKTALMYAYWDPENSPFTRNCYRRFYRTQPKVPDRTMVWLTRSSSRYAQLGMGMRNLRMVNQLQLAGLGDNLERNNSTAMWLACSGVVLLMHHSRVGGYEYLTLLPPWDKGWIRLWPAPEDAQWPQRPMKEHHLLTTFGMMGTELDLTPGVDIEGRTPEEVTRAHSARFAEGLLRLSGLDPEWIETDDVEVIVRVVDEELDD